MPQQDRKYATQKVGKTVLVELATVEPGYDESFNRWSNEERLPEQLALPGCVSSRRVKLYDGEGKGRGALQYLCMWQLTSPEALTTPKALSGHSVQNNQYMTIREHVTDSLEGIYTQIYPLEGAFERYASPTVRQASLAEQCVGGALLVAWMEVEAEWDEVFNRWYNDEHLPEQLTIPGWIGARRFKLCSDWGTGMLRYMCVWELESREALSSPEADAARKRPKSKLSKLAHDHITNQCRGLYQQIYFLEGRSLK